jgi:hypothetical protein
LSVGIDSFILWKLFLTVTDFVMKVFSHDDTAMTDIQPDEATNKTEKRKDSN